VRLLQTSCERYHQVSQLRSLQQHVMKTATLLIVSRTQHTIFVCVLVSEPLYQLCWFFVLNVSFHAEKDHRQQTSFRWEDLGVLLLHAHISAFRDYSAVAQHPSKLHHPSNKERDGCPSGFLGWPR
jgi:hypothetical protein